MQKTGQTSYGQGYGASFPGFIDDLHHFFNDWTLGARGTFIDPSGGTASAVDISKVQDRPLLNIVHAAEWRRVNRIFRSIPKADQDVLTAAYTQRGWDQFTGASLVFGGLVGVALLVTEDYEGLLGAFRDKDNSSKRAIIESTRKAVEGALKRAHRAYIDAEYVDALEKPCRVNYARG